MTVTAMPKFRDEQALNEWMAEHHLRGQWIDAATREQGLHNPKPFGEPHLWSGTVIREGLFAAAELVKLGANDARRTTRLVHPDLVSSSATMTMAVQLVMPGEVALAHRHTPSAIRFIVDGSVDAYTVTDGEKCTMERGDMILTPNWTWHEHHNVGVEPTLWIDGLDVPLVNALRANFFESYPSAEGVQPLVSDLDSAVLHPGVVRPPGARPASQLVYKWRDTETALAAMPTSEQSPFDGRLLEYPNAFYGGSHTLRNLTCWIQQLQPGERTQFHRHTYTHLYHGFEGAGSVECEGSELSWERGDCFVVPNWTWHRHRNDSASDVATLFSMNDLPILEAAGLLREEDSGAPQSK